MLSLLETIVNSIITLVDLCLTHYVPLKAFMCALDDCDILLSIYFRMPVYEYPYIVELYLMYYTHVSGECS